MPQLVGAALDNLRSVARDLEALGIMTTPGSALLFEVMGRLRGDAPHIKAGNYELPAGTNLAKLLAKLTEGDATLTAFTAEACIADVRRHALSGAVPVAGKRVGVILTAGNVDLTQVSKWIAAR